MKKLLAILLSLTMILSLASCGGEKTEPSDGGQKTSEPSSSQTAKEEKKDPAEPAANDAIAELESKYVDLTEDELKWEYDTASKTIVISGEGPMRDYRDEAPEWDKYNAEAQKVVIGKDVTSVGAGAFLWFSALTEVSLGESVEFIGDSAFSDCYELRTVNFPDSLKYVGMASFSNALLHSDSGFTFPEGMLFLGVDSFFSAFKENGVKIPASLTSICYGAFSNTYVTEFNVDENNPAFASIDGVLYDKNITTLINYPPQKTDTVFEIPGTVTTILRDAIEVTSDLEKLVIPASVQTIEEGAIFWNYSLSYIDVAEDSEYFMSDEGVLFTKDGGYLVCYPIGNGWTEYYVPEGTERICSYALGNDGDLVELHVGEGLTEIGEFALFNCYSLWSAELPSTLTSIESDAFESCYSLGEIRYMGSADDWQNVAIAEGNELLTDGSVTVYCAQ